jgi:hypothetical protein
MGTWLTLSPTTIPAGPVEFTVTNQSSSTVHEFLFTRWAKPDDALPYDKKTQQVREDALKGLQGIEDLRPRDTVTAQFILHKGRYVVFCNEPGHYRDGMETEFVVVPGRSKSRDSIRLGKVLSRWPRQCAGFSPLRLPSALVATKTTRLALASDWLPPVHESIPKRCCDYVGSPRRRQVK